MSLPRVSSPLLSSSLFLSFFSSPPLSSYIIRPYSSPSLGPDYSEQQMLLFLPLSSPARSDHLVLFHTISTCQLSCHFVPQLLFPFTHSFYFSLFTLLLSSSSFPLSLLPSFFSPSPPHPSCLPSSAQYQPHRRAVM